MPIGPAEDGAAACRRLMLRARRGDQRAAERLWASLAPAMRAAVAAAVDHELADDAAQDAFLRMIEAPRATVRGVVSPRAWMCVLALNAARNAARTEARRRGRERDRPGPADAETAVGTPHGLAQATDDRARLRRALAGLDEPDRVLIVLRSVVGLPLQAVAAELGLPRSTAADRHRAALTRLRARFQSEPSALGQYLTTAAARDPARDPVHDPAHDPARAGPAAAPAPEPGKRSR